MSENKITSYPKEKINILFLENISDVAVKHFNASGLGWRVNIFSDGNKVIYHNGWWHGSNSTFIRLIRENATVIVIGNKFNRSIYNAKILASVLGNYYLQPDEEETDTIKILFKK